MTFLHALVRSGLKMEDTSTSSVKTRTVSYILDIDLQGNVLALVDVQGDVLEHAIGEGLQGRSGRNPASYFLADNATYLFGTNWVDTNAGLKYTSQPRQEGFTELVVEAHSDPELRATLEPVVRVLNTFKGMSDTEMLGIIPKPEEFNFKGLVVFRIVDTEGEVSFPHLDPKVQAYWHEKYTNVKKGESTEVFDLISGECVEAPRLNKRTSMGKWGTFNDDAYINFGEEVLPLSFEHSEAYVNALNMIAGKKSPYKKAFKESTLLFWGLRGKPDPLAEFLLEPQEALQHFQSTLAVPFQSGIVPSHEKSEMFFAHVTKNSARGVLMSWRQSTYEECVKNLEDWCSYLEIHTSNGTRTAPNLYYMATSILPSYTNTKGFEEAHNQSLWRKVVEELAMSAFFGAPLPKRTASALVSKISRNRKVNATHAQFIRLYLHRQGITMSDKLDDKDNNPFYLLGQILSELDRVQYAAMTSRSANKKSPNRKAGTELLAAIRKSPERALAQAYSKFAIYKRTLDGRGEGYKTNRFRELVNRLPEGMNFGRRLNDTQYLQVAFGFNRAESTHWEKVSGSQGDD